MQDPRKNLKKEIRNMSHGIDPGKAAHTELTQQTDELEKVNERLLELKDAIGEIELNINLEPVINKLEELKVVENNNEIQETNKLLGQLINESKQPWNVKLILQLK
jgi:hypothetical protein